MHATQTRSNTGSTAEYRMQVQEIGDGAPLMLVGGGLTGSMSWEPHARLLADSRRVARAQLLSVQHGLQDRPLPDEYSVRMESAALAAALDGLEWTAPVDVVAWSYGALVALDWALARADRVRTLALIEPPAAWVLPDGRRDPDVQALRRVVEAISDDVTEADLESFVRGVGLCPPGMEPRELPQWPAWMVHRRSLRTRAKPLDHRDDPARLRAFERPVLLVTGTGTAPLLRRIHEALAMQLPHARTLELPAGHAPQLVSMDRFLAELVRFQALDLPENDPSH